MSTEPQPNLKDIQPLKDRIAAARKRLLPHEDQTGQGDGPAIQAEDAWKNWDNVWVQFNQR